MDDELKNSPLITFLCGFICIYVRVGLPLLFSTYIYICADVDDELKENSDHMYQSYIYMAIYVYIILPWMPMDGLIA